MNTDRGFSKSQSFDAETRGAEVQDESGLKLQRFHVVQGLRYERGLDTVGCFDLGDDRSFDDEIRDVFPNRLPSIKNGNSDLISDVETLVSHLDDQCALVDFLEEPGAQCVADLESGGDDPRSDRDRA